MIFGYILGPAFHYINRAYVYAHLLCADSIFFPSFNGGHHRRQDLVAISSTAELASEIRPSKPHDDVFVINPPTSAVAPKISHQAPPSAPAKYDRALYPVSYPEDGVAPQQ